MTSTPPRPALPREPPDYLGLGVALAAVVGMLIFAWLGATLNYLLAQVVLIALVIWQACDPFAEAAQWVGDRFRLPGSVRGATLDAIASSMPELFSGIFFVVVAFSVAHEQAGDLAEAVGEGYGATIATCAGSAVYNMMLIPALCALVVALTRPQHPTVDVEEVVVSRDGLWSVGCQFLLLVFLYQDEMGWPMAVVFLGLYPFYVFRLYRDAQEHRRAWHHAVEALKRHGPDHPTDEVVSTVEESGAKLDPAAVKKIRQAVRRGDPEAALEDDEDEAPERARVLFGLLNVPLSHGTVWLVLAGATAVAAVACYFLVEATRDTAAVLGVPTFFIAVIVAAAASSIPDTFMSIGAARRGDDSGAVSNAFGSNVFDLCICLSVPLLISCWLNDWQPISLLQDGRPMPGLVGLRTLLWVLTIITLLIIWHKRQLTWRKGLVLCALYSVFILYAVLGSLGFLV